MGIKRRYIYLKKKEKKKRCGIDKSRDFLCVVVSRFPIFGFTCRGVNNKAAKRGGIKTLPRGHLTVIHPGKLESKKKIHKIKNHQSFSSIDVFKLN